MIHVESLLHSMKMAPILSQLLGMASWSYKSQECEGKAIKSHKTLL